jgi:multidrug efflux pump subunit AcrA (membrane-fusion protein)
VYALQADGRVRQLRVEPGRRAGDRVEVLEGLDSGTRFVASGAGFLNDGDLVKESTARPATPLM